MTLKHINPSGNTIEVVNRMPFTGVWMDKSECNDRIFLRFQEEGSREITHEIIEPIHVKLREEGKDHQKGVQIDAENGTTLLLFSSGKIQELLEGIQR